MPTVNIYRIETAGNNTLAIVGMPGVQAARVYNCSTPECSHAKAITHAVPLTNRVIELPPPADLRQLLETILSGRAPE